VVYNGVNCNNDWRSGVKCNKFYGGSYLAKYLSGDNVDKERERHDKALEQYQRDYQKYIV